MYFFTNPGLTAKPRNLNPGLRFAFRNQNVVQTLPKEKIEIIQSNFIGMNLIRGNRLTDLSFVFYFRRFYKIQR
ncbi:hypothetical protein B2G51_02630 [Leptospira santarosai]|nr:hypothetical protein B2G51_02630 [Leptospira santarosai]OLY59370.1 hypothetical protein BV917_15380 [Leptospira santarosai serovar Guaricura]